MAGEKQFMLGQRVVLHDMGFKIRAESAKGERAAQISRSALEGLNIKSELLKIQERNPDFNKPRELANAYVVSSFVMWTESLARSSFLAGNAENFALWFDISFGAGFVTGAVSTSEEKIRDEKDDSLIKNALEEAEAVHQDADIEHEAQVYLQMQRMALGGSKLLLRDQTGFVLVDEILKHIKGEPNEFVDLPFGSFSAKILAIKGAEIAVELYKKAYPVAEDVMGR